MTMSCEQVAQAAVFPTFPRAGSIRKSGKVATVATDCAELCPSNYSADRGAVCPETLRDKSSGASGFRVCFPHFSISFFTWRKMGKKPCITTCATEPRRLRCPTTFCVLFVRGTQCTPVPPFKASKDPFFWRATLATHAHARQEGRGGVKTARPTPHPHQPYNERTLKQVLRIRQ